MDRVTGKDRGTHFRGVRVWALGALLFTVAACGDDASAPSAPRLPAHISAAMSDSRIGRGVPDRFRQTGIEHNRLTLLTAKKLRGESRGFGDPVRRCAAVRRVLHGEAERTAQSLGAAGREVLLRNALDRTLSRFEGCPFSSVASASLVALPSGAAAMGDSVAPSQTAFDALARLDEQVGAATDAGQVDAALATAASAAASMTELDAAAVYAAVAQTQASIVLWESGGPGWKEFSTAPPAESLFRLAAFAPLSNWATFKLAIGADLLGCLGAIRYLRQLPIIQDPRLLLGVCGLTAAAFSIITAYELIFDEE